VAVPIPTPVTTPVALTVATPGVLLLHVPPPVALANAAVPPRQMLTGLVGVMGDIAFTVTVIKLVHPVVSVKVILAVPALMPVSRPVEPIVATAVLLLIQVPPVGVETNVTLLPAQTVCGPEISGLGLTVNTTVALLVPTVYEIIHVPAVMPVTIPVEEPTVAIAVLVLLQTPPDVVSVNVRVEPIQTLAVPLMPLTVTPFTCMVCMAMQPPGKV